MNKDNSIKRILTFDTLPEKIKNLVIEKTGERLNIGDWFYYNTANEFHKVVGFENNKYGARILTNIYYLPDFKNPVTNKDYYFSEYTDPEESLISNKLIPDEAYISEHSIEDYLRYYRKLSSNEVEEYYQESQKLIKGEISTDFYLNQIEEVRDETAVLAPNSKEALNALSEDMAKKQRHLQNLELFVMAEMEKQKAALDTIRSGLNEIVQKFEVQIQKIYRVIKVIELYLGIDEEIVQIQEGPPASPETPISFRQQILFMDEEVGDFEIDFKEENIRKFDEWILKGDNIDEILPEKKGVVALCPRRKSKFYSSDWREQAAADEANKETYILIRNGSNVYRIYGLINVRPRFFPLRKELGEMLEKLEKESNDERRRWYDKDKMTDTERELHGYRQRAFLLQGLLDRTQIFEPLPQKLSIFNLDKAGGLVNFIYDDEVTLPTGRLAFWDWHKLINSKIERGSRVINSGMYDGYRSRGFDRDSSRFFKYYRNEYSLPDYPSSGQYVVEEIIKDTTDWISERDFENFKEEYIEHKILETRKSHRIKKELESGKYEFYDEHCIRYDKKYLIIKYNPGGEVWSWGDSWGHERKNNISFKVYRDDSFILNYDQISLEDIDFYLKSRTDRSEYAHLVPLLMKLRELRLKELEHEKQFVQFLVEEVSRKGYIPKPNIDIEDIIWSYIDWWKHKNIWKRPVTKDDHLATRMIERRLFSEKSIKSLFVKK